jgi:hypothetical protein
MPLDKVNLTGRLATSYNLIRGNVKISKGQTMAPIPNQLRGGVRATWSPKPYIIQTTVEISDCSRQNV